MDKLLYEYEKNAGIKSNLANFIWKGGVVLFAILYLVFDENEFGNNYIIFCIGFLLILYMIAEYIFLRKAISRINYNEKICFRNLKKIYFEINKYQKDWITKFCKRNKIDNFNKLNTVLQELKMSEGKSTIKYIDPIIIGTLAIAIWEQSLQKLSEKIGFFNMLAIAMFSIIAISIVIGIFTKMITDDKEFFLRFDTYSSKKRLEKLIVYRILKCKR